MTVSITGLANHAQAALSDELAATWPLANLEQWVREGIADYSIHFPRIITSTISATANTRQYDLSPYFRGMITVEFPTSQDPPEYLKRRPYTHPDFWTEDGYYDVLDKHDETAVPQLLISEKPAGTETITITFSADHPSNTSDAGSADATTVPNRHHDMIIMYVMWRAAVERISSEEQSPTDSTGMLLEQMSRDAETRRRMYVNSMARALKSQKGTPSITTKWNIPDYGRIY